MFMRMPFSKWLSWPQHALKETTRSQTTKNEVSGRPGRRGRLIHVVVDNEKPQAAPAPNPTRRQLKTVIVERENILPFVDYAPYKEKLTREEVLEKILIKNEELHNRPVRKTILLFYWIYIALLINAGLLLFYYL